MLRRAGSVDRSDRHSLALRLDLKEQSMPAVTSSSLSDESLAPLLQLPHRLHDHSCCPCYVGPLLRHDLLFPHQNILLLSAPFTDRRVERLRILVVIVSYISHWAIAVRIHQLHLILHQAVDQLLLLPCFQQAILAAELFEIRHLHPLQIFLIKQNLVLSHLLSDIWPSGSYLNTDPSHRSLSEKASVTFARTLVAERSRAQGAIYS
mmetsp:Transcript_51680/g.160874  ORF Transcript_51680/g.160874 Transcript_51680/m.160874 type:complete len:207 (+) Transcript_51680:562-1182(+)